MEEQTPYNEGELAFGATKMRDCPYPWGNPSWREWWKGWRDAGTTDTTNQQKGKMNNEEIQTICKPVVHRI